MATAGMKGLPWIIACLALAAGLFMGYLDYRQRHVAVPVPTNTSTREKVAQPGPTLPSPPQSPRGGTLPSSSRPAPSPPPPSAEELARILREVEKGILREDFGAARKVIGDLVSKYEGYPQTHPFLEKVRRAERKAAAYAALIGSLETRLLPEELRAVSLQNGNTLIAKSVRETASGYEIEYVLGGKGLMVRDRVTAVKPLSRKEYLAQRWKEIQSEVATRKDPFDIFFLGVRKCFRDGLRQEGISLLDRLLLMPDSKQLVAMYAVDPDRTAVRAWEQAAGRAPLDPLSSQQSLAEAEGSAPEEELEEGDMDPAALRRARELIEQAEETYRQAGDDRSRLSDARAQVLSAAKILYGLPAHDHQVGALNRRAGDLLSKVMRDR